jgi:hypothetical protein
MKVVIDVIGLAMLLSCGLAMLLGLVVFVLWEVRQIVRLSCNITPRQPEFPEESLFSWETEPPAVRGEHGQDY